MSCNCSLGLGRIVLFICIGVFWQYAMMSPHLELFLYIQNFAKKENWRAFWKKRIHDGHLSRKCAIPTKDTDSRSRSLELKSPSVQQHKIVKKITLAISSNYGQQTIMLLRSCSWHRVFGSHWFDVAQSIANFMTWLMWGLLRSLLLLALSTLSGANKSWFQVEKTVINSIC